MAEVLARGLQRRGHEVVVFCRAGAPLHERLSDTIPCEPILGGSDFHPVTLWRCANALRRYQSEIVLANTVKDPRWTGVAARIMGIPVVYRHEIDEPLQNRAYYRIVYGWVPTHHIVNSEATRSTILGSADWIAPQSVSNIPNGIHLEPFDRAYPADLGLPTGAVAIGYVGRFETRKGIWELVEAWPRVAAAVPNAYLVIVGWDAVDGKFRAALEGAPRVRWLGFRRDVPAVMKALDLLVAPSHYEGFGLVLVEAMAAGTPAVATRVSSLPEIVTDGIEGLLVPSKDSDALADALIRLAQEPESRARMGAAGQARAGRCYTQERMLDAHEALLSRIVVGQA